MSDTCWINAATSTLVDVPTFDTTKAADFSGATTFDGFQHHWPFLTRSPLPLLQKRHPPLPLLQIKSKIRGQNQKNQMVVQMWTNQKKIRKRSTFLVFKRKNLLPNQPQSLQRLSATSPSQLIRRQKQKIRNLVGIHHDPQS